MPCISSMFAEGPCGAVVDLTCEVRVRQHRAPHRDGNSARSWSEVDVSLRVVDTRWPLDGNTYP
eukprot:3661385-Alexandrium_andersonii.AAC.1